MLSKTSLKTLLLLAAMAVAAPVAAANPYSQVIVFGDSLVDAGNLDVAVGSDIYNPVAKGYFPGRFTNGPDYTDLLNQRLFGSLLTPSLLGGTDYAFGGARAVDTGDPIPDLGLQFASYLGGHSVDPNALYVLNFGGNDVFGLTAGDIGAYPNSAAYAAAVIGTIVTGVETLSGLGAGHILAAGIPNVSPNAPTLDIDLQAALDAATLAPGTDLLRFSYLDFFRQLAANPVAFGVAPFTETGNCFDHRVPVGGSIDCSGFVTVDGIHPIAPIQAAIYREVAHITGVGTVPEPASWALLIAGFGLTGAAMRRRREVAIAAAVSG